ncbi:MAG: methyltransferase domain-containing protein [Candidatus Aminicenantales bacterium]
MRSTNLPSISGDYQARALDSSNPVQRYWHRAKLKIIDAVCPPVASGLILDAGCGSGHISHYLSRRGAEVLGIDGLASPVEFAARTYGSERCQFRQSFFNDLRDWGAFDQIYFLEVLEHLPESEAGETLERFHRLLRPRGLLFLTTPNTKSLWPIIEFSLDLLRLTPRMRGEQHLSSYSPALLKTLLRTNGFAVERIGTFNGLAPFAAVLGQPAADAIARLERTAGIPGNLIYLRARKTEDAG